MSEHTDNRMTAAELKVTRESLGLSGDWLATHLGVNSRTVREWEQGRRPVPDWVRLEVEDLEQFTAELVGDVVERLMGVDEPEIVTYRSDDEYHTICQGVSFPASWHRAACARVAKEVPALSIVYASDVAAAHAE